jgi:hypothetical protein
MVHWQARAGEHSQHVHEHLIQQPRELQLVQAHELRVKAQGQILWVAMAIMVSTRLWLGGVISVYQDFSLITLLVETVRA